ncbi:FKBP-type peptidyl-prolyl cis-trans isomerase [Desulfitobacterium hafniense]|uniref:FKBP-type peptidyl-prolyl cis-trans isomerase n=1 Tax=Desulfitobacterium hafniense TaxID=49338 RepID=UPI00037A1147|nr:FKBP-type peptidyl-prolyl cis-trans isomerase [Desulfitobacterium hafniense]
MAEKYRQRSGQCALVRFRGGPVGEEMVEDRSQGEPVRIIIGAGQVPPGVEDILNEMEIGSQGEYLIPSAKAYGAHDPEGVKTYPRWFVKGGERLEPGSIIAWEHPISRQSVPVKCIAATRDTVTIDFNHLLAGKDLCYWFELVALLD